MYSKISVVDAKKMMDNIKDIVIVDVRQEDELAEGYIENSILIPLEDVEKSVESIIPNKESKILVYCRSGKRSQTAGKIMDKLGYKYVYDFGGIIDWPFDVVM